MYTEAGVLQSNDEQLTDHSDLLAQMHTDIDAAFDELWAITPRREPETPQRAEKKHVEALAREHAFADKVVAASVDVTSRTDGPLTLLFDVDETIVKKDISTVEGHDVTRPALPVVVRALGKMLTNDVQVGLLTSRHQSHLDSESASPTFLACIADSLNPAFVVSSRDGDVAEQFSTRQYDEHVTARDALGDFLNSDLVVDDEFDTLKQIQTVTGSRVSWKGKKLPILKQLVDQNPDHSFVYVDDAASASVINPNYAANLATVQVYDDAVFTGLR